MSALTCCCDVVRGSRGVKLSSGQTTVLSVDVDTSNSMDGPWWRPAADFALSDAQAHFEKFLLVSRCGNTSLWRANLGQQ